jgi:hypothetical protein
MCILSDVEFGAKFSQLQITLSNAFVLHNSVQHYYNVQMKLLCKDARVR